MVLNIMMVPDVVSVHDAEYLYCFNSQCDTIVHRGRLQLQ